MCFFKTVEKYGRADQATDDSIVWRMCFAFFIIKAADTHTEYLVFLTTVF
jgi:hypothetical protein